MSLPSSGRTLVFAVCLVVVDATADPLHAIENGAFQHHDSGWIFPKQVGAFTRVGAPQDLDGTSDAQSHYARVDGELRTTVVVDVYPPDSAAATAKLTAAKAALRQSADAAPCAESPFQVRQGRTWVGIKVVCGQASKPQATLWFIDTGPWIVKVSAMVPSAAAATRESLDDFVREQRWDSLGRAL